MHDTVAAPETTRTRLNRLYRTCSLTGFLVPPVLVALNFALFPTGEAPFLVRLTNMLLWPLGGHWGFLFVEGGDDWDSDVILALIICMVLNAAYFCALGALAYGLRSLYRGLRHFTGNGTVEGGNY